MDRPETTPRERTLAVLVNLSAIPFPYIGPLIGYVLVGRSPYVRFHAIRLVLEEIALTAMSVVLIVISIGWSLTSLLRTGFDLSNIDWTFLHLKAAAFWIILQILALANTAAAIFSAVQAFQGKLPKRMKGLKGLAARIAGLSTPLALPSEGRR